MRTIRVSMFTLLAAGLLAAVAQAEPFHFTVTADQRDQADRFVGVLQSIDELVQGPGAFHVSVGDLDPPEPNRAAIDNVFGNTTVWYPIVGNHETETPSDMTWVRDEYNSGHDPARGALKSYTNQDGPASTQETTYSWDYANAHFIALNEYWDGTSDTGADGDVVGALRNWLAADLAANTRPFVFVFGHEPAYPRNRHVGDSLDQYPANRDAFWTLLETSKAQVYFCGHTHYYSDYRNPGGQVWQLDAGNAGNDPGDGLTFFDVIVGVNQAVINVYRDTIPDYATDSFSFTLAESITVDAYPVPGDANKDGGVDSADLAAWQRNYDPLGRNRNTFPMGDWDGNRRIDSADLAIWQRNYNPLGTLSTGTGLPEAAPEPATMTLVLTGMGMLIGTARRKRS